MQKIELRKSDEIKQTAQRLLLRISLILGVPIDRLP